MGRVVVITGGTSGIGLALKDLFEKNGDTVLTFSLDETGEQNHYVGSVSHDIKVRQVFNDIHERFGTIDILINCAGLGMSAITEIAPMEDINKVMDVNFYGTLYCTRAAIPHMVEGAKIINMSSAMAIFPVPFRSIYGASKSAVHSLSMSMRMELAPLGIEVVSMCPGDTKTNFTKNRIKDFTTTERYGDRLETATNTSDAQEDKRMTVEYVAEQLFKLINKKKCKPFYIIGGKYKFWYFLTRLTPKSLLLNRIAKKKGGVAKKPEPKAKKQKAVKEEVVESVASENIEEGVVTTENTPQTTQATESTEITPPVEGAEKQESKPSLNNILSKISIINKPAESESAPAETTSAEETPVTTENTTAEVEVASVEAESKNSTEIQE
jgi:short-subunit dehydrogenase